MKSISFFLLISLLFSSACSPQRRLNRLLENHPELTVSDTVRLRDTVAIPEATADTFVDLKIMTDTVIIEKDRLSVKLFKQHDTLFVEGKCAADTIYRELRIPVEKIKLVKVESKTGILTKILFLIAALITLTILLLILRPHLKLNT